MAISLKALRERFHREPGTAGGAKLVPFPARVGVEATASPMTTHPPVSWQGLAAGYRELAVSFEEELGLLWCRFRHHDRPSYTLPLLREMRDLQLGLQGASNQGPGDRSGMPRYLVWGSTVPGVWNLGGDLALFARLIRERDADRLRRYAHLCVDTLYANWTSLGLPLVTVALIQGDALGGGFEAALSDDLIVAEKG